MKGLNTEIDPRRLAGLKKDGPGFAQFLNLTTEGEIIRPLPSDGTHATTTFREQQLGLSIVSDTFSINGTSGFQAYVAQAGGTVYLRNGTGGTTALAIAAPGTAQSAGLADTGGSNGLAYGSTQTYALAYVTASGLVSGLSPTVEITNNVNQIVLGSGTGATAPVYLDTFAGTGTVTGTVSYMPTANWTTGGYINYVPGAGTVASGDVLIFSRGGTAYGTASCTLVNGTQDYALPYISSATALPTGAYKLASYGLGVDGAFYVLGTGATAATALFDNNYLSEYVDSDREALAPYSGPYDANGIPQTLVVPGTCQTLALHKGCLFLGEGNLIRWSEAAITGVEYGWFRQDYTMDVGGTVWALISRNEVLEVFTSGGIKYVVGQSPYFEMRDSQINERAVSRYSIVGTEWGTFYQGGDGLRVLRGGSSTNISNDWVTPWFDAIAGTAVGNTVAGASLGKYFLASGTRGLIFDWEGKEWQERTYGTAPVGFAWNDTNRYLVAKHGTGTGTSYSSIENGTTAQAWQIQYPTRGGAKNAPLPSFVWLDNVGPLYIDIYVDDILRQTIPVVGDTKGRIRFPQVRGVDWYAVLRGTGTPTTSKIRSVEA